jgi:hypothetical protein
MLSKLLLNFFLFFLICSLKAQNLSQLYKVEPISIIESIEKKSVSLIPHVVLSNGKQNEITNAINKEILDRFMMESFKQSELEQFRWYDVDFTYKIQDSILMISFAGSYYGAYINDISENMFFNLKNGMTLKERIFPFSSFFSLDGYYDFLNKHWLSECNTAFQEAIQCVGYDPYCDCYDIDISFQHEMEIVLSLVPDCFARVSRGCSPVHDYTVPVSTFLPYLTNFGKSVVMDTLYKKGDDLQKFMYYQKNISKIPDYWFIVGKIDGKYAFSMALQFDDAKKEVKGYYYYENKKIKIPISGTLNNDSMVLIEKLNGKPTGMFEFAFYDSYKREGIALDDRYMECKWTNLQTDKELGVKLDDLTRNK